LGLASEIPQIICDEFDIETRKCKSEVVEFLLLQGADFREGIYGQSYLHWAAENGHLSVVEYLFNQKADIKAKNNDVEFLYIMRLLFIELLDMVILVLLNI